MKLPVAIAFVLAAISAVVAVELAVSGATTSGEFGLAEPPRSTLPPAVIDPRTPRLARRVVLVVIDGLRFDHSHQPFLDSLRERGVGASAVALYPTWSRPGYVSALTGVPPPESGVRTNRVVTPVPFDSIMQRAREAGLRVATAGDIGMIPPLFLRPLGLELRGFDYRASRDELAAPKGTTWPFDDARWAESLAELEASTATLLAGRADFVIVLAGDVDRAGHAYGGDSTHYEDAAAGVDRGLARMFAKLDLSRDTIVVIADHGHSGRGGHGGTEAEVSTVPLILAGAGVVRGAMPRDATLVDVSPTLAALLGIPAPGHASGRTLVELLQLDRDAAARRIVADEVRLAAIAQPPATSSPDPGRFALSAVIVLVALVGALYLRRRNAMVFTRAAVAMGLSYAMLVAVLLVSTRAHFSPSQVPTAYRLERMLLLAWPTAIVAQLVLGLLVLRRRPAAVRLATANGLALVGLAIALLPIGAARIWFSPPHIAVPGPFWLVAIPAAELAGASAAAAAAGMLVIELVVFAVRRSQMR